MQLPLDNAPRSTFRQNQIRELYYITHINNVESILRYGILSHAQIKERGLNYTPTYNEEIVSRRSQIMAPNGKDLWHFANLYFQPRNPMMFRVIRQNSPKSLVVVGIRKAILERSDIYLTDGNAASSQTKFYPASDLRKIKRNIISELNRIFWSSVQGTKRTIMMECLVPDIVPPDYIDEIYVSDMEVAEQIRELAYKWNKYTVPQPDFFFGTRRSKQLTDKLSVLEGDMFFSTMQTLTISVNCVGIMGKGLASRAKYQFPDAYVYYQDACRNRNLRIGKPVLYKRESPSELELADDPQTMDPSSAETWFLLFPTKQHWRDNSRIEWIEEGLKVLRENYKKWGIRSLAVPALGCGLGRLDWKDVGPLLCEYLQLDIPVQIYLPEEKHIPDEQIEKEFLLGKTS